MATVDRWHSATDALSLLLDTTQTDAVVNAASEASEGSPAEHVAEGAALLCMCQSCAGRAVRGADCTRGETLPAVLERWLFHALRVCPHSPAGAAIAAAATAAAAGESHCQAEQLLWLLNLSRPRALPHAPKPPPPQGALDCLPARLRGVLLLLWARAAHPEDPMEEQLREASAQEGWPELRTGSDVSLQSEPAEVFLDGQSPDTKAPAFVCAHRNVPRTPRHPHLCVRTAMCLEPQGIRICVCAPRCDFEHAHAPRARVLSAPAPPEATPTTPQVPPEPLYLPLCRYHGVRAVRAVCDAVVG